MRKSTRESRRSRRKARRERLPVVTGGADKVVSSGGGMLLVAAARASGVDRALSQAFAAWRQRLARHDPGKIVLDLAVALAMGGDCLADIAQLRSQPGVFGPVASDPTVSRLIDRLAADAPKALAAIASARATARARVWALAGDRAPDHAADADSPIVIDLDATLVTAHSEKELAAPNYKRGFGFHPIGAWVDHGQDGTGEALSMILRPGNAGSNTAADHIAVTQQALAQLPDVGGRPGRKVLIRTDGAGGTHEFLGWLTRRRAQYSIGFGLTETLAQHVDVLPAAAWTPAYDADRRPRDGAWVAELTGLADLTGWPAGMRLIVRAERPHPGAQLRFTDADGNRLTAFVTNTRRGQLADLELRHRRRARCEDRIRTAKDVGLTNLPLHDFDPEPDLDRDRDARPRPHRLAATPRPARPRRTAVGTESAALPALHHRRQTRPHQPPHPPTPRPSAVHRPRDHRRHHPRRTRPRITRPPDPNPDQHHPPGPWNRHHPSDIGPTRPTQDQKRRPKTIKNDHHRTTPASQERSRLERVGPALQRYSVCTASPPADRTAPRANRLVGHLCHAQPDHQDSPAASPRLTPRPAGRSPGSIDRHQSPRWWPIVGTAGGDIGRGAGVSRRRGSSVS